MANFSSPDLKRFVYPGNSYTERSNILEQALIEGKVILTYNLADFIVEYGPDTCVEDKGTLDVTNVDFSVKTMGKKLFLLKSGKIKRIRLVMKRGVKKGIYIITPLVAVNSAFVPALEVLQSLYDPSAFLYGVKSNSTSGALDYSGHHFQFSYSPFRVTLKRESLFTPFKVKEFISGQACLDTFIDLNNGSLVGPQYPARFVLEEEYPNQGGYVVELTKNEVEQTVETQPTDGEDIAHFKEEEEETVVSPQGYAPQTDSSPANEDSRVAKLEARVCDLTKTVADLSIELNKAVNMIMTLVCTNKAGE